MKLGKRCLAILLVLGMLLGLTACGGSDEKSKVGNSKTDIEIRLWNAGLGEDWIKNMIEAFEKENPEYNVTYSATADEASVISSYGLEETDTIDLYMSVRNYDIRYAEPLNDVLESTAYGDSKTLKEKFNDNYLEFEKSADGNYYALTYGGGIMSLVYNKEIFKEAGVKELPRTTDELTTVCDKLHRAGYTPLAHFTGGGYWNFISEVWFSQASGMDYYLNRFYTCTDDKGNSPSMDALLNKDGRYDVLKAYEQIITPEYIMDGSNTTDHVVVQTKFLDGQAAMMVNGSWLANEMKTTGSTEGFAMMRLPVISSIKNRLETVKSDTVLRLLISAIDSVTDGEKQLSDYQSGDGYVVDGNQISTADWDIVAEARNTVAANYSGESAFIPTYSNAKEGAKEFLKFMYSDKGYKIYTDTLHITLPLAFSDAELDTTSWNAYEKNLNDISETATSFASFYIAGKHKIFIDGGVSSFIGLDYITGLCAKNSSDRITADGAWKKIEETIEGNYENNWLANIK